MSIKKKNKLGVFLCKLRVEYGITQREMAKELGIEASNLSAMENTSASIPHNFKDKVLNAYDLNEGQLEEFNNILSECNFTRQYNRRSSIREWAEMTCKILSKEQRKELIEAMKSIAE